MEFNEKEEARVKEDSSVSWAKVGIFTLVTWDVTPHLGNDAELSLTSRFWTFSA